MRIWDEGKVLQVFSAEDAHLILASRVPTIPKPDRVAWHNTLNGQYSVKAGYQLWCDNNLNTANVTQGKGWGKLWKLDVLHKVKTFLWWFCRNTVPVRRRLSTKGVTLPITWPMCGLDVEHKLHLFFDCSFASGCWQYVGLNYDMRQIEFAPDWLLHKLSTAEHDELVLIARVLWDIWFFRNKKVWTTR